MQLTTNSLIVYLPKVMCACSSQGIVQHNKHANKHAIKYVHTHSDLSFKRDNASGWIEMIQFLLKSLWRQFKFIITPLLETLSQNADIPYYSLNKGLTFNKFKQKGAWRETYRCSSSFRPSKAFSVMVLMLFFWSTLRTTHTQSHRFISLHS